MSTPIVKILPQWEWVLISENITVVTLNSLHTGYAFYFTVREVGGTAPDVIVPSKVPTEAIKIFNKENEFVLESQNPIDVYAFCFSMDNTFTGAGGLLVKEGIGTTPYGNGTAYLNVGQPFELKVNQGLVPGHSAIDKYGENPDVDLDSFPEDVWEVGGLYPFDPINTAPIVSVVSDDPTDTQILEIPTGLDITGATAPQTVQLNGTTRVALDTPLWRFNRGANLADVGGDLAGTVYFYTGTGNVPLAGEIRGVIDNGNNQTLMAIYTIPLGKVGYLYRGEIGGSRAQSFGEVQGAYYSSRVNKVQRVRKRVNVTNQGSSNYSDKRSFPDIIPALTDIVLRVEEVSANNTGVFGTFDILLVDDNLFPQEYLDKIGQPSEMPT